jgi:hypothetical protein
MVTKTASALPWRMMKTSSPFSEILFNTEEVGAGLKPAPTPAIHEYGQAAPGCQKQ